MVGLREYVISVAAAAWIVGCAEGLLQHQSGKALIRLIGGILIAVTLLSPMPHLNWEDLIQRTIKDYPDSSACVSMGRERSRDSLSAVIVSKTEAYILDKARSLNADISVEIRLSNDEVPVPKEVRIQGVISPQVQLVLSEVMERELGITKENQIWIS